MFDPQPQQHGRPAKSQTPPVAGAGRQAPARRGAGCAGGKDGGADSVGGGSRVCAAKWEEPPRVVGFPYCP